MTSASLLAMTFCFMLVLCRCAGAVMLLPGLGEEEPPAMVRGGLALGLAILLVPLEAPTFPHPPSSILVLAGMVTCELLVGGLLGWLARVLALALPAAGQIVSLMTGLSSVLQPDAVLGAQSAAIGRLFALLAPVLILASGLYALPLQALAGSYSMFPPGTGLPSGDLVEVAVRAVSGGFSLALRLAAPFILLSIVWQVGLGMLSRLVPSIQVYFASMPGQVLGGLLLVATLAAALLHAWLDAVGTAFAALPGL